MVLLASSKHTQNVERELPREQDKRGWVQQHCTFGGSRCAIYMVWRSRCTAASDPESSDRRLRGRVGRGVSYWIRLKLFLNHLLHVGRSLRSTLRSGKSLADLGYWSTTQAPISIPVGRSDGRTVGDYALSPAPRGVKFGRSVGRTDGLKFYSLRHGRPWPSMAGRRKRGKTSNLDGSGHKGLSDFVETTICLVMITFIIRNPVLEGNGNPNYLSITCSTVTVIDKKRKLEKLYESKGNQSKLCSYRPVGGESSLAHLFGFVGPKWKLETPYECKGIKPKLLLI